MVLETRQNVTPPTEAVPVPVTQAPLRLKGWDHIAISAPDMVAAERWYVETLGGEVVGRYGWGGDTDHAVPPHEDIRIGKEIFSLFWGDSYESSPPPRLFHYAFHCEGMEESDQWRAHLTERGVAVRGPVAHPGFGAVSLYFTDPWGTKLEICTWLADYATAEREALARGGSIAGRPGR